MHTESRMRLLVEKQGTLDVKGMEAAPVFLILGIILVVLGFVLVAAVTLARFPDPSSIFEYSAFGLFAAGIICIWAAWHKLS